MDRQKYLVNNATLTDNTPLFEAGAIDGVADVLFINNGDATATIMGQTLAQGESLRINGNVGESDQTRYIVKFGSGTLKEVNVIYRAYQND